MEFHVLASGSKGNATFVYEDGCGILIDCGITRKQLLYKLEQLGFNDSDITYVFLTHDHYDHNKNIHIFEGMKILGGSNDGAGSIKDGFVCRGGRMLNEETYENFGNYSIEFLHLTILVKA